MSTKSGLFATGAAKLVAALATLCALAIGAVVGIVAAPTDGTKVVLEPIDKISADSAWVTGGLDVTEDEEQVAQDYADYDPGDDIPDTREQRTTATLAGNTVSGGDAGVYGGSRDTQVCDKTVLVAFFTDTSNADARAAWADVLGLLPEQVENYLDGLTGARLRWDTRLTDTGWQKQKVKTWQALLQAGTAVLVDNTGVPRVKCNTGSPLLSPQGLSSSNDDDLELDDIAENPGDAWEDLDPQDVVTITPGTDSLDSLTIVDIDSDDEGGDQEDGMLQRDVGSDGVSSKDVGTGDVQFTLRWTSLADLDIHVTDPDGNTYGIGEDIAPSNPDEDPITSDNGGYQDLDANIRCQPENDDRVGGVATENVFWPPGKAPSGTYQVWIDGYTDSVESCGESGTFTLIATIGGEQQVINGSVTEDSDRRYDPYTFEKP